MKTAKLRQLVRTYPQATAGTPQAYHYDADTGRFTFSYVPNRSITAPTQVFVSPLTSPHGYDVRATNARYTHVRVDRAAHRHLRPRRSRS